MSQDGSGLWGLPLDQYLESLKGRSSKQPVPSRLEVISALQKVYNQSLSVSWASFKDIQGVIFYPEEMSKLTQKDNTLSSSCVRLLLDHSRRANGLLRYQYGCLGLQVVVLSLLITFIGYSSPESLAPLGHRESVETVEQLSAISSGSLWFGLTLHGAPPENIRQKSSHRSLGSLMGWDSNMTDTDLDNLLSLLVAERQSLFELFRLMPNTQGWSLLFLVLWVKLAPECDSDNQRAMSPLKRLYQLNDLLGRYCLAATNDKTLNIVYTISRWMSYRLLPLMGKPGFFPTPTDQAELPSMKKVAIRRLKSPPTPWRIMNTFEGDPTSADLLSILLEFITSYQTFSFRPLDDTDLLLSDAVFARLWVEAQSDRALAGLVGRQNADKLAYAAFRNASFTILGIQDNEKNPTGLRRASAIYSAGLQRAGLVDLIGRILLMPILPRAFGTTLIATQDNETTLRYLDPSWFHMVGYIDRVPGLLQDYYEQAVKCFDQDYATWLKVLRFLQVQDRSTPYCKRYFEQCQDTWEKLGKHARFLTKTTRRCAHTGCINSIFLHTVPLLCCSECLGIYYCSKRCQTQAWEIQDPGSHRLGCGGVSEIWEILSHEHRVIALQSLEGWHMGMINGNF